MDDDDIFTDAEIMGPSHGSFVVFIARGIGIIVAIAVIIVSTLFISDYFWALLTSRICLLNQSGLLMLSFLRMSLSLLIHSAGVTVILGLWVILLHYGLKRKRISWESFLNTFANACT